MENANGCQHAGRKRWKLLAPENTALLMDRFGREMAPFFDTTDSQSRFPNISKAAALVIELEQASAFYNHSCICAVQIKTSFAAQYAYLKE